MNVGAFIAFNKRITVEHKGEICIGAPAAPSRNRCVRTAIAYKKRCNDHDDKSWLNCAAHCLAPQNVHVFLKGS
jgi:hypothetical protein